jgi:hypothetical protein
LLLQSNEELVLSEDESPITKTVASEKTLTTETNARAAIFELSGLRLCHHHVRGKFLVVLCLGLDNVVAPIVFNAFIREYNIQ